MKGWLAADIGGTKLAAAAFDGNSLLAREQIETHPERGAEDVLERLARLMERTAKQAAVEPLGAGVACPGPLSSRRGVVENAPLLGWRDVPVVRWLTRRLGMPVVLENDANAAALGELRAGAGTGCESLAYITVSTGVGCGIVLGGRVLRGFHESAGELGHLVIEPDGLPCACGRRGCLEMYASGTAITRRAKELCVQRGEDPESMDARLASARAREGDAGCRALFEAAGTALGRGVAMLRQLLDVERIVVGGSVSASFDLMRPAFLQSVEAGSYWSEHPEEWLRPAKLQPDSGLYGAAWLARERFEQ